MSTKSTVPEPDATDAAEGQNPEAIEESTPSAKDGTDKKRQEKAAPKPKKKRAPRKSPAKAEDKSADTGDVAAEGKATKEKAAGGKAKPEPQPAAETAAPAPKSFPEKLNFNDFQARSLGQLYDEATTAEIRVPGGKGKHQLVYDILCQYSRRGSVIEAEGILELTPDGRGFLRWPATNFRPNPDDVQVSHAVSKKFRLQAGQLLKVTVRAPKEREKTLQVDEVLAIEGTVPEEREETVSFDKLTAMFPSERIILENGELGSVSARVVDLVAPLGKGQRGLIAAPPRGGKTILLKQIASAIAANHPEIELIVMLLDERPEEVTDFEDTVNTQVFSSTFDEPATRHVQVAELVMERAKRIVEDGRDVVVLLDSITRLARGYNNLSGKKGGTMSGGIGQAALQKPRKFFGAARNVEEGGSLTILATALIETEARMDEVIFEEFKGTGNMEIHIDRQLAEQRIFPAIHILQSGTRKDDLLYHPDEMQRVNLLRRQLAQRPLGEAMEVLIRNIENTGSNAEILLSGIK